MSTATKAAVSLLIIDDNAGSLELLASALAQQGLEILTASDPETGLDLVARKASADCPDGSGDAAPERAGSAGARSWSSIRRST